MTWAILLGGFLGSIPTADLLARSRGHDLRASGSGNPGTANALRVAGKKVAVAILVIDILKGTGAVLIGDAFAGTGGAAAGGVAAIAGQVLNPWFAFRGGKGLGVTAGVTIAAWPPGLLVVLPVISAGATVLRAAGGAVLGLSAYLTAAALWAANDWPTWWGLPANDRLVWMAMGVVTLTLPKFVGDLARRRS